MVKLYRAALPAECRCSGSFVIILDTTRSLWKKLSVSLTTYYYYPHLVQLTDEELEAYQELSAKIAQLAGRDDERAQESLKILLIHRAELLNR